MEALDYIAQAIHYTSCVNSRAEICLGCSKWLTFISREAWGSAVCHQTVMQISGITSLILYIAQNRIIMTLYKITVKWLGWGLHVVSKAPAQTGFEAEGGLWEVFWKKVKMLQYIWGVMYRDPAMRKWSAETFGRVCCNLVGSSSNSQGKKHLSWHFVDLADREKIQI